MNFFTVSGVAATRVSPGAVSLTTAIFMPRDLAEDMMTRSDDKAGDRAPFQQPHEAFIVVTWCATPASADCPEEARRAPSCPLS